MSIPANLLLSPLFTPGFGRGQPDWRFFAPFRCWVRFSLFWYGFWPDCFYNLPLFCPASALRLFSAAAPRLLSPFSRWPPQSDTVPLRRTAGSSPPRCASLFVIGGTTVSTQALVQNRQIHCYTAAFEKKLLQIFSYGGHAIVIGHLSGQAQIEQAVLELQLENVHTIDALILLPAGGSPAGFPLPH